MSSSDRSYPVKGGVARFVPDDVYASNFGVQWNTFSRTQLDRYNGTTLSRDRFRLVTGWDLADLAGKRVLDAGRSEIHRIPGRRIGLPVTARR